MDYLLKANAIIILFYLCYKLFLQGETFFESNRYFLLTGLAIASIIPFIVIPIYVTVTPALNEFNFIATENIIQPKVEEPFDFLQLFQWIYLLGIIVFTIKFLIEFTGLLLILIQNKRIKKGHYTYVETEKNHSPFSFFKYIVFNPNHFNVTELEHIILHEKVHAKQYHSIDILITKITSVLFWFNPFIWLYNKSLQQNLEFIADSNTQRKITDTKSYQTLLLKTVLSARQMTLVNNFYNSLIKKRIIMLHKSKSKQLNVWKYTLILPLLGLFLMSFNTEEVYITEHNTAKLPGAVIETAIATETVIITKNSSKQDLENAKKQFSKLGVTLKFKGVKRNDTGEITAIKASFKSPEDNKGNYNVFRSGGIKAFKFYYDLTTGEVGFSNVSDTTFIVKGTPNENVYIYSKDDNKGTYKVKKSSKTVKGYSYSTDDDTVEDVKVIVEGKPTKLVKGKKSKNVYIYSTDDKNKKENKDVEVIIEGKPNKEKKGAVYIYKDENNDDEGQNFKINVDEGDHKIILRSSGDSKTPIFVKDGEIISSVELDRINPNKVASVNVLKGDTAISLYGADAKDGAVIITTKVEAGSSVINKDNIVFIKDNKKVYLGDIKKKSLTDASENYLYILDGKEISKTELEKVYSLETVASMTILKGKKAIRKYGEKGKNGVVEVTSK